MINRIFVFAYTHNLCLKENFILISEIKLFYSCPFS